MLKLQDFIDIPTKSTTLQTIKDNFYNLKKLKKLSREKLSLISIIKIRIIKIIKEVENKPLKLIIIYQIKEKTFLLFLNQWKTM